MKTPTIYAYFFYFFYNSLNKKGNFLVQFKTHLMLLWLELVAIGAIVIYYVDACKVVIPQGANLLVRASIVIPLVVINFWIFERNDNWRKYLAAFDEWPPEKRKRYNSIVKFIIAFVIANLIVSIYFLSEIDWRQYR